jgi:hypothetical protein
MAVVAAVIFSAIGNSATISLNWQPSTDLHVVGYNVYVASKSDSQTNVVQVGKTSAATLSSLTEGVEYRVYVTAFDANGVESDPSNYVDFTPAPTAPVSQQRLANVTLAWEPATGANVSGYRVYASLVSGGSTNVVQAGKLTSATVSGLVQGQTYRFFVTALDTAGGESAPSNVVDYTIPTAPADAAPALGLLQDQVVVGGDTLQFQATAMDMSVPSQSIIFSLGAGAPAGASIDPITGLFSWTPAASQIPSAQSITVVVTDSGGLSAQGTFNVIAATPGSYYALKFGGFSNGSAQHTPYGMMSASGEMYVAGSTVTLEATAISGFTCTGWTINSVFYPNNPITVTMSKNVLATPVFKKSSGTTAPEQPTQISMSIGMASGKPAISIGGELGAWVLEGSSNLKNWIQVANGLTSEEVSLDGDSLCAFYRVRTATLLAFDSTQAVPVNVNP